jgi:hypothetical protein
MADDKPKNAEFIGKVVKDAKNPVETRMLSGWFGDSGEKGTRRLYTDAELTSYSDIPDDAILYTEPIKDSQPAGGVLVWIKRDASVQSGGSSASRAGRFLQGQVAADFGAPGSLEKAGLRCVTEVPCGEPTGFTGQCTKQPNVGGAWPCVTEVPHCVEVTGFTGQCTNAPWPQPTRYVGCTVLHCPTHDLTHIPYICNIVASGQPGCVVVNPPQGGEVEKKAGIAAESERVAETALPGCGYTKTWGLCETHLLGCGYTKSWGQCPTNPILCDPAGPQQPNDAFRVAAPAPNIPISAQACMSPVPCSDFVICQPTQMLNCNQTKAPTALCSPAPKVCDTFCGPNCQTKQVQPICTSVNCVTPAGQPCPPPTKPPQCPAPSVTSGGINCCRIEQQADAFGAQAQCAGGTIHPTIWTQIGPACPPTHLLGCGYTHQWGYHCLPQITQPFVCPPQSGFICPSGFCVTEACGFSQACQPAGGGQQQQFAQQAVGAPRTLATVCTQFGCQHTHQLGCPTGGVDCTVVVCTHVGPLCPPHNTLQTVCTQPVLCQVHTRDIRCIQPITHPPQCPVASGFNCPSAICPQSIACQSQACQPGGGFEQQAQFFGAQAHAAAPQQWQPIQTLATVCTQFQCPTQPNGDCTFFGGCGHTQLGCPTHAPMLCMSHPVACPTGGIDCTVICPTHHLPHCPTAPATICPTHLHPCPTGGIDCTVICPTHHVTQCPTAPATICPTHLPAACQPLTQPPQCPVASGFNCPSAICPQSIACQSQACQPQGGGLQQQAQAVGVPHSVACQIVPTHLMVCRVRTIEGFGCLQTFQGFQCFHSAAPCPM